MKNLKWVFFDCMETLIDLTELPGLRDYAFWAFDGSGVEDCWDGFDAFFEDYNAARKELAALFPESSEYEIYERFKLASSMRMPGAHEKLLKKVSSRLYENYWANYKARCYVKEDTRDVLGKLCGRYRLGVVSNFMVRGGIEELLKINEISHYFEFIITSINVGWRKPHYNIYKSAMETAGVPSDSIVFIGDDYENDFVTPLRLGMEAILLDRNSRHEEIAARASDFYEIGKMLL